MATTKFRNIALLGATGNLGSRILTALVNAGFTVTAIQRKDSTNKAVGASRSLKVDLTSEPDLTTAFQDQDVVVSALPNPRLASDKIWMNAAISAGVKRIVPSEFSSNLEKELSQALPIVTEKLKIREFVKGLAASGKIEWTSINNGPFLIPFIWLSGWMGPGFASKVTALHDGGDKIVCATTLERVGEGVARSLLPEYAEATKNKPIYVYSSPMTERKMTSLVSKLSGIEFKENEQSVEAITKYALDAIEKGDLSKKEMLYIPFCFGDGYGGDFRYQASNELLGLKESTDAEIEDIVKGWLKELAAKES